MNTLIKKHLEKIEKQEKLECWYIVKQDTTFWKQCYCAYIFEKYNDINSQENIENFFEKEAKKLNEERNLDIPTNHRAGKVAFYYGLITDPEKKYRQYNKSVVTSVYKKIKELTNTQFEKVELYEDIMIKQIEKMYISSEIDEKSKDLRSKFQIFPIIFLYKILLELGKGTGKYEISYDEYRYFLSVQENYSDFLNTLLLIIESRENPEIFENLKKYKEKLDSRLVNVIEQLNSILMINKSVFISLKNEKIKYVEEIVRAFEDNIQYFEKSNESDYNYIDFLISNHDFKRNFNSNTIEKKLKNSTNKPHQRIFFGAPGTGKSYLLNEDAKKYFGNNYERVTFHPNYMYGNFIGTFKPFPDKSEDGKETKTIMYKYIPGVLLRLLIKAIKNPATNYLLIIEEINRANTAAVFGDFFQLLDRNGNGESEYGIAVSEDLKLYLEEEFDKNNLTENEKRYLGEKLDKITLPPNFYIWATMNSADQGVMPLDTAFKRRWEFEYTGIDDAYNKSKDESGKSEFDDYKFRANGKELSNWNDFRIKINEILSKCHVSEDKLIGPYFISKSILASKDIDKITNAIKNKVLMYLYEDAGRQHRKRIFKEGKWETYSKLCEAFDENCEEIFNDKVELPDKTPIEVGEEIIRGTKEEEKIQENETEITENTESIDE